MRVRWAAVSADRRLVTGGVPVLRAPREFRFVLWGHISWGLWASPAKFPADVMQLRGQEPLI